MSDTITSFEGKHRFLSNFWKAAVHYEDRKYPSVEHAFQASKTPHKPSRRWFQTQQVTATQAKQKGKTLTLRDDWEEVKFQIMFNLVYEKFHRHPLLRKKLLATKNAQLVENNYWGDVYWGVCSGEGANNLGKILMLVRDSLSGVKFSRERTNAQ